MWLACLNCSTRLTYFLDVDAVIATLVSHLGGLSAGGACPGLPASLFGVLIEFGS